MTQTVSARDRVLDAFETLLISHGERGATLEATATLAGVSKGGLLYHFGSREALSLGLLDRFADRARADTAAMVASAEGPVRYLLRTSTYTGDAFDLTYVAVSRLAQAEDPRAGEALERTRADWLSVIARAVDSPALAETVMLISDGMYLHSALHGGVQPPSSEGVSPEDVLAVIAPLLPPGA